MLKSREICEKLGISRWTLYKWVEEGRVKVVRLPSNMLMILERVRLRELSKVSRAVVRSVRLSKNVFKIFVELGAISGS